MGNNVYKVLGMIFMIAGGIFYTAERIAEKLSAAIVAAGYASSGRGVDRAAEGIPFFENFFVWFFFFIGFILLAYGFPKSKND